MIDDILLKVERVKIFLCIPKCPQSQSDPTSHNTMNIILLLSVFIILLTTTSTVESCKPKPPLVCGTDEKLYRDRTQMPKGVDYACTMGHELEGGGQWKNGKCTCDKSVALKH